MKSHQEMTEKKQKVQIKLKSQCVAGLGKSYKRSAIEN